MNVRSLFLLFCLSAIAAVSLAVQQDKIAGMLRQGNAHGLAQLFAPEVDLTIAGQENTWPKAQAEQALQKFFDGAHPSDARILHNISSNSAFNYEVFTLNSGKGIFRVSCTLKNINGVSVIIELGIETDKVK